MMYGSSDMEHNRQNFLSFWTIFCTFTHSWPKKSKFCKNEKKYRDIIILHMCTINDNHTMYGSWNMEQDGHNFLSFWTIFCPFTLLTTSKIKILKTWKKCLEILSFDTYMPYMIIIWCMVPEIRSTTEFFVILDYLLPFNPPNNPENQNFEKMEKPPGHINILHMCTINDNHIMYGSWAMKCGRHNFL